MAYNLRSRTIREELLDESEEQPILGGDDTDGAEDHMSEQSEESSSDGEESSRLSEAGQNIIPGPVNTEASTIEEFWSLLINDEIINLIVQHTNAKIKDVCAKMMAEDQDTQTGMWKQSSVHYERLWDRSNGTTTYRCTMPKARFMFLSSSLRFDDKTTRSATDKFGPIRAVWDIFIRNCQRYYKLHNNCTVDEQLLGFRDRCSFRMYIKSKPDKYGLNIVSLNDACTSYMYNAIPYLGKTSTPPNESVSEYFLREVTAPIHGTNRNVTCDNWFTSVPITRRLLEPYRLCITGTIQKNKREIPQAMKIAEREPPASKYCYDDNLTFVSYTPKKNKVVLLLTSYLHGNNKETDGKPDIVHFYNKDKGGTDCFDMLCHSFTVSRRTNRWPMQIFFGILDQAAVN
ncbi:piggyBac transposable element-derived protein 4-like, partial [Temnothorax curvispinosus]|uniref:PiggyBac transposable element-derived protein 4-like n=1 Tax=Temnothorax curvispinosus TaxID=300111 RepID=A0A6J1RHA9_9HYME